MLVDEINRNTDYDLRIQPWREYSTTRARLHVALKANSLDKPFKQLQLLAWERGVTLDRHSTLTLLKKIIDGTASHATHG